MMQFRRYVYLALALLWMTASAVNAQLSNSRLLYFESFNNPAGMGAVLNAQNIVTSSGPVRNTGDNQFFRGTGFSGSGMWPNVQRQTEAVGRFSEPDTGGYIYIRSIRALASQVDNANFNPQSESDRFMAIGYGAPQVFCTRGFDTVVVNFYWIGEGDRANGQVASAELYYSEDGGRLWKPYMKDGQRKPLIDDRGVWNYTHGGLSMPNWIDQSELCFGIRWTNSRSTDGQMMNNEGVLPISFGLDEFSVIGKVDPNNPGGDNPVQIRGLSTREICKGDGVEFQFRFMKPTCNCQLTVELSNPEGGFGVGATEIQTSPIGAPTWEGGVWYTFPAALNSVPQSVQEGNRYCLRITRYCDLPPLVTHSEEICPITIKECPPKVQVTHKPPVSNDERLDTVCVLSVFDVPFNTEIGVNRFFLSDNDYRLEISDQNGNWQTPPVYLPGGLFGDPRPYPIRAQPGLISSYIPEFFTNNPQVRWNEGCNYYVRVISTSPASQGAPWGPFCIRYCDIETNSTDNPDPSTPSGQTDRDLGRQQNVIICVNDVEGGSIEMPFDINEWIKLAQEGEIDGFDPLEYLNPNNFWVELWAGTISNGQLRMLHRGRLGSVETTEGGTVRVRVPALDSLYQLQLIPTPGMLYLRIVADNARNPKDPDGELEQFYPDMPGTFIRLTVGYPYKENTLFLLGDATRGYCAPELVTFDFGVYRFDAAKGSCYTVMGRFFETQPTEAELEQIRRDIENGVEGAFDFSFGWLCPAQGWFTPGANFDYRPDPSQPPMRIGRHRVNFRIPADFQGKANYVYMFTRERNGANSRGEACYSDVSNGVPIKLLTPDFGVQNIPNKACVGVPFNAGLTFREETVYDIRLVNPENYDERLDLAANKVRVLADGANEFRIVFEEPGIYFLRAEALNRCGSADEIIQVEVVARPEIRGIEDEYNLCDGDPLVITPEYTNPSGGVTYEWQEVQPDGSIRTIQTDTTRFEMIGRVGENRDLIFYVNDLFFEHCRLEQQLRVNVGKFEFDLGPERNLCFGEEITITSSVGNSYRWDAHPSIVSGALDQRSIRVLPNETTMYKVTGDGFVSENKVCPGADSVWVYVFAPTQANDVVAVCDGNTKPILLDAKNPGATYEWKKIINGNEQYIGDRQQVRVRDIARYTVAVTAPDRTEPCFIQEFEVVPVTVGEPTQTPMACLAKVSTLSAGVDGGIYQWSTGATTKDITVYTPGMYWVDIYFDDRLCARQHFVVKLDCPEFAINPPNAFTPNKDAGQINEYWRVWIPGITKYTCRIYDRWGHAIWEDIRGEGEKAILIDTDQDGSMHQAIMWDGMYKGEVVKEGVYIYVIEAESGTGETIKLVGNITVIF